MQSKLIKSPLNENVLDRSRGAKEEAESIPEDLESMEDGQLFDNQPVKLILLFVPLLNAMVPLDLHPTCLGL